MKDLHNHLIYNVDDGSTSKELSIKILKEMEIKGVTDIVLTPHYIIGTNYNTNNQDKLNKLNDLQQHTNIKLYLGNEVFIDNNIIKYINDKQISTINNTKYLLIELPLNNKLEEADNILFNLRNNNIVPIIAHPERYHYIDTNTLEQYINMGCLLQGNISSLYGKYGKTSQKNLKNLLKKHMIHLLGTDTHNTPINLEKSYQTLSKIVDDKMKEELLNSNFDKIINNLNIEPYPIINKKSIFRKRWKMKYIKIIIIIFTLTFNIKVKAMTKEDVINLANSITICSSSNSSLVKGFKTSYIRMINERDISENDLNTIYNNINKAINILKKYNICSTSDKDKISSSDKTELLNLYNKTNDIILNSPKISEITTSKTETNIVIDKTNEEIKIYDNGVLSNVIKNTNKLNYVGINKTVELLIVILSLLFIILIILKILKINNIITNSLLNIVILLNIIILPFKNQISNGLNLLSIMKTNTNTTSKETVVKDNKIVSYPSYGSNYGNITINNQTGNIYFGDSTTILKQGIGQLSTTKLPGEGGTTVLSGHNTGLFKELNNLKTNDIITIQTTYGKFKYKVKTNKIVKETDITSIEQNYDLIMYTCYPNTDIYGNKRLIIYANQISSEFYGDTKWKK